jgi:predicted RNA-binding Zn-ribbon protein involved in translation (DUF1610 family)
VADVADMANDVAQAALDRSIRAVTAAPFEEGAAGECNECGDESERIVRGRCARCREPKKGYARG